MFRVVMDVPYPEGEFLLPLFPLPSVVVFPRTRVPLHIFEPRYRKMVSDALSGQERIGMCLLRPGWESNYHGSPPVHEYGTMGKIEDVVALEDGRYNLILTGIVRYRIIEHVSEHPYRVARVVAAPEEQPSPMDAWAHREWLVELSNRYMEVLPDQEPVPELASANLESLTNALVMALQLTPQDRQFLLELGAIVERAGKIAETLEEKLETIEFLRPFRDPAGDPSLN